MFVNETFAQMVLNFVTVNFLTNMEHRPLVSDKTFSSFRHGNIALIVKISFLILFGLLCLSQLCCEALLSNRRLQYCLCPAVDGVKSA